MTEAGNSAASRDIAYVLHPYTNLERHKTVGPQVMAKGKGIWVYDEEGKLNYVGRVRIYEDAAEIGRLLEPLVGGSGFTGRAANRAAHWSNHSSASSGRAFHAVRPMIPHARECGARIPPSVRVR